MTYEIAPYGTEEAKVAPYVLPDPLLKADGSKVENACEWMNFQRGKILQLFKDFEYGEILPRPDSTCFELLNTRNDALGNTAIRKEIRIHVGMNNGKTFSFDLLLYIPHDAAEPVPAFLGLNFKGNHNTTDEVDVRPTGYIVPGCLDDRNRGVQTYRWQFAETVRRGYASATVCYHDIHPDRTGNTAGSVFSIFFDEPEYEAICDRYSVIGAWSWGLSRALDYLESDPAIDASRVALHGHSRLGKTSLWAGATDPRFKIVISNDSGCGGGALHKRKFGENFSQHFEAHIRAGVPAWFVRKAEKFIRKEENMPMDQHELVALIAPRPVCLATATLDLMADPEGEFISCLEASEVYNLFGSKGMTASSR